MFPFNQQPGAGGQGGLPLLFQFHWLTIAAIVLGGAGMAMVRIVTMPRDQRPRWTYYGRGHLAAWIANGLACVASIAIAIYLGSDPKIARQSLQIGLLLLLLCLNVGQAVRSFVAWSEARSRVWAIRHGDVIAQWAIRGTLIGFLLTVMYILRAQT